MDPEVEVTIGRDAAGPRPARPRPALHVRLIELLGLGLVGYGLASNAFGLAAVGGALIFMSYALYRRKHGAGPTSGSGPDSPDSDAGGGGD